MPDTVSADTLRQLETTLRRGAASLGLRDVEPLIPRLTAYYGLLVRWMPRVRLLGRADPDTVALRHFLDSLTAVSFVADLPGSDPTLLDVGAGAGFPGLPLALARPSLQVLLVDSDRRKVAFMSTAIAELGLDNAQARWVRLTGDPEGEGIPRATGVISRAFQDIDRWVPLARPYLRPGGRLIAMLGARRPEADALSALADAHGLRVERTWTGQLPDGEARALVALRDDT